MASRALGQDLLVGSELGHYLVVEKIGAGGMGEVYLARDQHLARDVAIKVLPPGTLTDQSARKHFHKEALILSQLNHPNVATIHDFNTQQGVDFLVMEYIPGVTLSEKMASGPLAEKEVLRLGMQLAEGLAAAHERGVIHRDLKPGNLRVTRDGRLKILDFGLAKLWRPVTASAATESLTETPAMAGTLPYMAPEQLLGEEIDARTDLHAAGLVLYEMATGRYPFADAENSQLIGAILHRTPRPATALNSKLSPELERIIKKCLEKEAENRYQSAKELAVDLRRLDRAEESGQIGALVVPRILKDWEKAVIAAGLVFVLLPLAAFLLVRMRRGTETMRLPPASMASIAVLPFADLSPAHDHEYFSEGLAEEILNDLTKIPGLKVAARGSAFQFKGRSEDSRVVGKKLDVTNILEGSVQTSGNRIRITVHLSKADAGVSLWSENYDRDLKDVFAVEDDIAAAVTSALRPALLGGQPHASLAPSRTTSPEAHEAFLQARSLFRTGDHELQEKAFDYVNRAIQSDPHYAPAYALRSVMTAEFALMGNSHLAPALESSRRDAEQATKLDPNMAAGYLALSEIQAMAQWDWKNAEQSARKARELAPGDADVLAQCGFMAFSQARLTEAANLMSRGVALDPLDPGKHSMLAAVLLDAGNYQASSLELEKTLELSPYSVWAHEMQGERYLAQGRAEDALVEMEKEPKGAWQDFGKALAYYSLGRRRDSDDALAQLIAQHQGIAAYQIAEVYSYRHEADQAFEWLERARFQRDGGIARIKSNWLINNLRNDPRYEKLLHQVNLLPE